MSSEWKAARNRENAKKSSGPKTSEGRNVARHNALKHGLTAETLVAVGEDAEAFQRMADAHRACSGRVTKLSSNSPGRLLWRRGGASVV